MACTCQIPITWHKFLLQIELKKQKIFFFFFPNRYKTYKELKNPYFANLEVGIQTKKYQLEDGQSWKFLLLDMDLSS